MSERNPHTPGVIGPDERDIREVNSLNPSSKPSRLSQLASSRLVRAGGAVVGVSAAVAAVEMIKEADLTAPAPIVRAAEAKNELQINGPLKFTRPERRFLSPYIVNPSFEMPQGLRIVREGGTFHLEAERPRGWEAVDPANSEYHFREDGAYQGRSFVSDDLMMADGCITEGEGWQQEGWMRINPNNTYNLSSFARYHDVAEGVTAMPRYQVDIFDRQGGQVGQITNDLYFSAGEGNWEQINALAIGPEGTFPWPENAASVRISLSAVGETSGDTCVPGKIATVDFDDVSFRP